MWLKYGSKIYEKKIGTKILASKNTKKFSQKNTWKKIQKKYDQNQHTTKQTLRRLFFRFKEPD